MAYRLETFYETENVFPGGSNKSVVNDIANLGTVPFENPTRDFLSNIRNYLDIFKNAIFCGFFWATLVVIFFCAINIKDLLAIGYLIGSFIFLWQGSDLYLQPIKIIISRWTLLLWYNVFNILVKVLLQFPGCVYNEQFRYGACWLVHILGVECVHLTLGPNTAVPKDECARVPHRPELFWDAACFAFLIFQMRIFKSHYFCHIINETKANTLLASR